jgi:hypothetical protein
MKRSNYRDGAIACTGNGFGVMAELRLFGL